MKIQSFRDLRIWQEAHSLTLAVYKETKAFPIEERFGLTAQIRRSATSVAANIAEGMGRRSTADYLRFLYMALGSAQETLYHSILANDLGYFSPEIAKSLVERLAAYPQDCKRQSRSSRPLNKLPNLSSTKALNHYCNASAIR